MFHRPRYLGTGKPFAPYSAENKVPSAALPNIHNDPFQPLPGSAEGYHLSLAAYNALLANLNTPQYLEPMMTSAGDILTLGSGDIVMAFVTIARTPAIV